MKKTLPKLLLAAFTLLACGCQAPSETPTAKEDTSDSFADASYAMMSNSLKTMSNTAEINGKLLFFPSYLSEKGTAQYTVLCDEEAVRILNADPQSACDLAHINSCTSLFTGSSTNFTGYNGKLYYTSMTMGKEDADFYQIRRRNADGSEDELLTEIAKNNQEDSLAFSFTIHRNKLYYSDITSIYVLDLATKKEKTFLSFEEGTEIGSLFFDKDTLYIDMSIYVKDGKIYQNVVLKTSLKYPQPEVWKENISVRYVNDSFLIIDRKEGEEIRIVFQDLKSGKETVMLDDYSFGAFIGKEYIVLSEIYMKELYLYSMNGELLDTIDISKTGSYPQGFSGDSFWLANSESIYRIKIADGSFEAITPVFTSE